jgi:hypothetical protein
MNKIIFITVLFFTIISCKQENSTTVQPSEPEIAAPSGPKYKLIPFTPSTEFPDAAINGYSYKEGKFSYKISGKSYELGQQTADADSKMCANSDKGQHLHIIMNNQPYSAQYNADFDYPLENGNYYFVSFLSRSYHESIKTKAAHRADFISVDKSNLITTRPIDKEMVIYSRPKGTYVGKKETEKVMLDFYLVNTELSVDGNRILVDINGETHFVDHWQPYEITGLPIGENTITLTLIDKTGLRVETPYNPVSRTFTLKEEPILEN